MRYKHKSKTTYTKLNCNNKLSKLFNILQTNGITVSSLTYNKRYDIVIKYKCDILYWSKNNDFIDVCNNDIDTVNLNLSLEDVVDIIFKICNINKVVDYNVSDSFFLTYTEITKLVDVPYGKDVKWSKYFDFYRSKGDKFDNMQVAYRTKICPYGRKKGFSYNSADIALVAIVNKATQRRLNKIKLW